MQSHKSYFIATARGFAGALIFSFPLLMTMEMWRLGAYVPPLRQALLLVVAAPGLVLLSHYSGFEKTRGLIWDVSDALAALAIGVVTAAVMSSVFGILSPNDGWSEINGKIAVQSVPGAIGAMVARKQFAAADGEPKEKRKAGYWGTIFLMAVGAMYLSLNVVATEEAVLISYRMSPWHGVILVMLSLAVLHGLVYSVGLAGSKEPEKEGFWPLFAFYTLAGYAVSVLSVAYLLWTFGYITGVGATDLAMPVAVMSFPAALGAATSRLIL